jgi:hypothetical protein
VYLLTFLDQAMVAVESGAVTDLQHQTPTLKSHCTVIQITPFDISPIPLFFENAAQLPLLSFFLLFSQFVLLFQFKPFEQAYKFKRSSST